MRAIRHLNSDVVLSRLPNLHVFIETRKFCPFEFTRRVLAVVKVVLSESIGVIARFGTNLHVSHCGEIALLINSHGWLF